MKVFIQNLHREELSYIWSIFAQNKSIPYSLVDSSTAPDLIISSESKADIQVSNNFLELLDKGSFNHSFHFKKDCCIRTAEGKIDYLSTAFYMINSLQEFNHLNNDRFGRFPYKESYQYKFKNTDENLVQILFDNLFAEVPKFKSLKDKKEQSKVFLSHDIDSVYGSLLQDSFYTLKKGRIELMAGIIFKNLFMNPEWLNMDRIMKIENEHDFKSTFYWLVTNKKFNIGIKNADYIYSGKKIQNEIKRVKENGCENGLHKSASEISFEEEITKMKFQPQGNRFHFLRLNVQNDFEKIEKANLKLDTSLGFAEEIGFRNSYGLPFQPFNMKSKRAFNFIECPLNVMDTTFHVYKKTTGNQMVTDVINFFEKNKNNCVLSILFHNSYVTEYKFSEFNKAFKSLLSYFKDNKFDCITQTQIIEKYLEH